MLEVEVVAIAPKPELVVPDESNLAPVNELKRDPAAPPAKAWMPPVTSATPELAALIMTISVVETSKEPPPLEVK
jgi:hypothetical protein